MYHVVICSLHAEDIHGATEIDDVDMSMARPNSATDNLKIFG